MPIRLRKFIGAILLITLVVSWALVAMALAQAPAIKANGLIEVIYYVVAGLGWVLPAMPLVALDVAARRRVAEAAGRRVPRFGASDVDGLPFAWAPLRGGRASVEVPCWRSVAQPGQRTSPGTGVPSSNSALRRTQSTT